MSLWPRAALAGSLGFAVSLVAACGGGNGLLSGNQAASLSTRLDQVSSAVSAHNCNGVSNATSQLVSAVSNLPSTVSGTLRADLTQGVSTVSELAARDCQATTPTTATNTHTNTTTTNTTTTSTTTTATTPTNTTTTSTTTPATTTTSTGTTGTTTSSGGGGLGGGGSAGGGQSGASSGASPSNG